MANEPGASRGVEIVSPSMPAKGTRQGKLTLEDFELDEQGLVVRCLMEQSPVETSVAEVRLQVLFDPVAYAGCPRQGDFPAAAIGRRERRWQYTHDRVRQRGRRLQDASEEFRDRYRWRAGIELTMSRFKHQMGMAKLRIRGMAKVTNCAGIPSRLVRRPFFRSLRSSECPWHWGRSNVHDRIRGA